MILNRLHLAKRTSCLAAVAVAALGLAGCQGISGVHQSSQVRIIDASPDAPALDIHQNANVGLYNVAFGTVSSYIPLTAGSYTHSAYTAGTQQQLAAIRGSFAIGGQYTVLTGNVAANLQMTVLRDQATPAPSGQTAFRFLNQATRTGAIDLYLLPSGSTLNGISPIASGLNFGSNTGYINAPSGTYSIVAFPTGSAPSAAAPEYTGNQTIYPGSSARTIILIDQLPPQPRSTAPGLQIITADDYDATSAS
jgi:Domain of unknown function (DUF4397)